MIDIDELKQKDKDIIIIDTDNIIHDPNMQIECHVYDLDGNYIDSIYNLNKSLYTIDAGMLKGETDLTGSIQPENENIV